MAKEKEGRGLEVDRKKHRELLVESPRLVDFGLIDAFRRMVRGRGMEFDGFKEFVPGDDAKFIDWKATLRSDKTLARVFKQEKDIKLMMIVDGGSTMIFSSHDKLKIEYALEVASSLAFSASLAGESVGGMVFTEKIQYFSAPAPGRLQYQKVLKNLLDPYLYGGGSDIIKALKYATEHLKPNSVVMILSDFLDLPEHWGGALGMATDKMDVLGLMIRDPRDIEMPAKTIGDVVIENPQTGETLIFRPEEIGGEYARVAQQQYDEVGRVFRKRMGDLIDLRTDEMYVNKLINFFISRMSKWR